MTIKEIAELCGVSDQTVLNWIHRLESLNQKIWLRLSEKLEHGSPEHPSDYDLGETIAIIQDGGGNKTLASLLAENAVTKNALTVQSEAMAKIAKLIDKLPEWAEWYEKSKNLPEQFEKFKGYAVETYKKLEGRQDGLEARIEGAYKEVLDNATANAAAEVKEYLLSSHKPSAHEAQLAGLKRHFSTTIVATGGRRDKIELFRLYPDYESHVANPLPKEAFAANALLLYPQINFSTNGVVRQTLRIQNTYGLNTDVNLTRRAGIVTDVTAALEAASAT
jgi:predicted transcriptional regulator